MNVKQVIVIRRDLKMRRGKEIAQGAHASIAFLANRITEYLQGTRSAEHDPFLDNLLSTAERGWVAGNFRKICLIVNSEEELLEIVREAREAGLRTELIEDSGLTEFHGEPTFTAAAIGPDYDEKIDPITGNLTLY